MLRGSLVSMGQVWAVESVACSTLMYVGVLLNSPILALALYGGSFIGSVCGQSLALHWILFFWGIFLLVFLHKTSFLPSVISV